jgi:hypothetical protein
MLADDRRQFQRLKLAKPILALIGKENALIIDIGLTGALIEHYGTRAVGDRLNLVFRWHGADVAYQCEVRRSTVIRSPGNDPSKKVSRTAIHFVKPVGDSESLLEDMIATSIGRMLAAQKANASGAREAEGALMLEDMGGALRGRTSGYVTYRLLGKRWWRENTNSPAQPVDGFTVARHEDEEELDVLCDAYELADEEGRRLIRLVAELSARSTRPT